MVEISIDESLCTVEYDYPDFHLKLHCFICSLLSGEIKLVVHKDAKWLAADELHSVQWLPADIDLLDKILFWYKGRGNMNG